MAKKSRRARKAQAARVSKATQSQVAQTPNVSAVTEPRHDDNFTQDYYYVYSDIRFLAVVTLIMIAAMVGLSFVI